MIFLFSEYVFLKIHKIRLEAELYSFPYYKYQKWRDNCWNLWIRIWETKVSQKKSLKILHFKYSCLKNAHYGKSNFLKFFTNIFQTKLVSNTRTKIWASIWFDILNILILNIKCDISYVVQRSNFKIIMYYYYGKTNKNTKKCTDFTLKNVRTVDKQL